MQSRTGYFLGIIGVVLLTALISLRVAAQLREHKPMQFTLESTAFANGHAIDKKHTADGDDVSPPLSWRNAPAGTREFALVCDDPDAPSPEPWVHWLAYGIPATVNELPEHVATKARLAEPVQLLQRRNSWSAGNTIGYRGPAPPHGSGTHHYHFKLYALDAALNLKPSLTKAELSKAIAGHVLAETELVGAYSR